MLRLFFALQPAPRQNALLLETAAPWISLLRAQPVAAENLHATLCFVGAVAEEKLDLLKGAASQVRSRAITLCFDRLDYWTKPRVLCVTSSDSDSAAPAQTLSARLTAAAVAAGFAPDAKPFRPHLTVARKADSTLAAECEWPRALETPLTMRCDHFVLMRSERGETGSIYSVVARWALDDDKSQ